MRRFQVLSNGRPAGEGVAWTGGGVTGLFRLDDGEGGAWFDEDTLEGARRWLCEMFTMNALGEPEIRWIDQEHGMGLEVQPLEEKP